MAFHNLTAFGILRPLVLVSVLALVACGQKPQQNPGGMKVPVSVVQVQPQPTVINTELPGRVQAIEDAEVRARVNGIVESIDFEQGSEVKKGQLLFTIDPAPYRAARDQAAAQLKNAQAAEYTAQLQAKRFAALVKQHAVAQQDYDNAVAQARQTAASAAAAKAALEATTINLDYTRVVSPIDGRIGKSFVTVGALVSATSATSLATVQRLNEVYVDITQPVAQLSTLRRQLAEGILKPDAQGNTQAEVLLGDGDVYRHKGKLLFSGVSVDPGTGQVNLRALFPNPEQILLPGLYVRVLLAQGVDQKALVVPEQAIQRAADGRSTIVKVTDGKANFTPVELGPRAGQGYIVSQGLQAGDQIVVEGFQKIRPGAPVQPMPWKPAGAATQSQSH
ncbi:MAG: efflux RND transporter periplasmic adaptor subunit [Castellaniella sp.]|uniref:efflux RND transporter periplasmic adaptor subunit n=1 Tax=Castellaniella sp. TaxID=1955812 RepID=UPI0011F5A947|nr:efflux RND transporter periplasmic adaptor subunit [Castellaniella sp.]TAN30698.1 MAG: efflux RND transporter periplasmic adaptor subunit [Castellaniella sp.]